MRRLQLYGWTERTKCDGRAVICQRDTVVDGAGRLPSLPCQVNPGHNKRIKRKKHVAFSCKKVDGKKSIRWFVQGATTNLGWLLTGHSPMFCSSGRFSLSVLLLLSWVLKRICFCRCDTSPIRYLVLVYHLVYSSRCETSLVAPPVVSALIESSTLVVIRRPSVVEEAVSVLVSGVAHRLCFGRLSSISHHRSVRTAPLTLLCM